MEILQELIAIVSVRVGNYILQHDPIKFIEDHEKIKEMSAEGRQVIIRRDGFVLSLNKHQPNSC